MNILSSFHHRLKTMKGKVTGRTCIVAILVQLLALVKPSTSDVIIYRDNVDNIKFLDFITAENCARGYEVSYIGDYNGQHQYPISWNVQDMPKTSFYAANKQKYVTGVMTDEEQKCVPVQMSAANFHVSRHYLKSGGYLIMDTMDNCVLKRSVLDYSWSIFAGTCSEPGYRDGKGSQAKFSRLYHSIQYPNTAELLICDHDNQRLVKINLETKMVDTFAALVVKPLGIAVHANQRDIYFSYPGGIGKLDVENPGNVQYITAIDGQFGHRDGTLRNAKFSNLPISITFIAENVLLVADYNNNVIRVINTLTEFVTTICLPGKPTESPLPIDRCELDHPLSFHILNEDDTVQVGMRGSVGALKYRVLEPSDPSETTLEADELTTTESLRTQATSERFSVRQTSPYLNAAGTSPTQRSKTTTQKEHEPKTTPMSKGQDLTVHPQTPSAQNTPTDPTQHGSKDQLTSGLKGIAETTDPLWQKMDTTLHEEESHEKDEPYTNQEEATEASIKSSPQNQTLKTTIAIVVPFSLTIMIVVFIVYRYKMHRESLRSGSAIPKESNNSFRQEGQESLAESSDVYATQNTDSVQPSDSTKVTGYTRKSTRNQQKAESSFKPKDNTGEYYDYAGEAGNTGYENGSSAFSTSDGQDRPPSHRAPSLPPRTVRDYGEYLEPKGDCNVKREDVGYECMDNKTKSDTRNYCTGLN